jgi:hypothetical protein
MDPSRKAVCPGSLINTIVLVMSFRGDKGTLKDLGIDFVLICQLTLWL